MRRFLLAGHGDEAERLGWPLDELYAVPPLWSRVDLRGAALLIGDAAVISITADEIRLQTASGSIQTLRRKPAIDYGLIYRSRLQILLRDVDRSEAEARAYDFTVAAAVRAGFDHEAAKAVALAARTGRAQCPTTIRGSRTLRRPCGLWSVLLP